MENLCAPEQEAIEKLRHQVSELTAKLGRCTNQLTTTRELLDRYRTLLHEALADTQDPPVE